MTFQTVKLGRERFVLLREKDFRQLQQQAKSKVRIAAKSPRVAASDRQDIVVAKRRSTEATLPYSQLRKELGLA